MAICNVDKRMIPYNKGTERYRPLNIYRGSQKIAGWHPETLSGEAVEFVDTYNDKVGAMTVCGKTEQTVTVQGKNRFDKSSMVMLLDGMYVDASAKIIANANMTSVVISCEPSAIYTVSKTAGAFFRVVSTSVYPYNRLTISEFKVNDTATSVTITTGADAKYLVASVWRTTDTITKSNMLNSVQIEHGPTATDYTPFVPNSPTDAYPSVPRSSDICNLISTDGVSESHIILPVRRGVKLPSTATAWTYIDGTGQKWYTDTLTYVGNGIWSFQPRIDPAIDTCTTRNISVVYAEYMLSPLPEPELLTLGELLTFPRHTDIYQDTTGVKAWITATAKVMEV